MNSDISQDKDKLNQLVGQTEEIAELKKRLKEYQKGADNTPKVKQEKIELEKQETSEALHLLPAVESANEPNVPSSLKLRLPSRQYISKRIKMSIKLDGYSHDVHFQHLLYEESMLSSETKYYRWHFGFRFGSYFAHTGRKILIKTLVHTNSKLMNRRLTVKSFPGLQAYFQDKNIDPDVLEKPLTSGAVDFFSNQNNLKEILKFLYAFCTFLYSFLPQKKRIYTQKANIEAFSLSNSDVPGSDVVVKQEDEDAHVVGLARLKSENTNNTSSHI